jgi:acetolactate synthase I/II/III large subunit
VNGAQALIRTLSGCGVAACFSNPGTSEMHFVAALDTAPQLRGVLCLFEGVATGAADGYGRMAGRPAATLLHLGPGLANGLANLHNAHRAGTPLLNVVGDHATHHKRFDAPLESDIESLARPVSSWIRRAAHSADVGADAADAVAAARRPPGGVATLILPADVCWSDGGQPAAPPLIRLPAPVPEAVICSATAALRSGEPSVLLLGGAALRRPGLEAASQIAAATGARLLGETFPARLERGTGLPALDRLAYLPEFATAQLAGTRHLILAGARAPVSFFAYPGQPSSLVPAGCQVQPLAEPGEDVCGALAALAELAAPGARPVLQEPRRPEMPGGSGGARAGGAGAGTGLSGGTGGDGVLTAESAAAVIGALLPEGAIVSDEANTSGLWLPAATAGAPPHDWLTLTGGAIGQGLPLATGAAIACPDRRVLALEADGSAMYTISALWTHAREQLDITTVIFSNRAYAILGMELQRVGTAAAPAVAGQAPTGAAADEAAGGEAAGVQVAAGQAAAGEAAAGEAARSLLDLSRPDLDFTALAAGLGVPASCARTTAEFAEQLTRALAEPGPHLIEAVVPPVI